MKGVYPVSNLTVFKIDNFEDMTGLALNDRTSMVRGESLGIMNSFFSGDETFLDVKAVLASAIKTDASFIAFELASLDEGAMNALNSTENSIEFRVNSTIPEPSAYAAIFGALALGFAAYRRR